MDELLYVVIVIVVAAGVITPVAARLDLAYRRIEKALTYISIAIMLFVMCFVFSEVVMRYVFNSPIPGHLEGAELLLPMIVFLAISYTQSVNGHVGMNIIVDSLPPEIRKWLNFTTLVLSLLTCSVLSYFSFKFAYNTYLIDDVTMTPPYWRVWPSAVTVPIGYMTISIRMYLQLYQSLRPDLMPEPVQEETMQSAD